MRAAERPDGRMRVGTAASGGMRAASRAGGPMRAMRRDDGSILPLVLLGAFLGLTLIIVAIGATSLYLERKRLLSLADGAALAGAEAFDLAAVGPGGDWRAPNLDSGDVLGAVEDHLAVVPHRLEGLELVQAGTPDGRSARVVLAAEWRPPVVGAVLPEALRLEVSATARSVLVAP